MLDGLRGLAIVMVVASHGFYVNPNVPGWLLWVGSFIGGGAIGVQMFFVLSGFLISYPFLKATHSGSKRLISQVTQPAVASRSFPRICCACCFCRFFTPGGMEMLSC